ncbi:MAG: TIR domain-containing protein [Cytophagales bacterium]|nr:TIR domain-containing protein [Cytophagales bacterium]
MWHLIPAAIIGHLILTRDEDSGFYEKIELDYRRIYVCHSFYDSRSYKQLIKKLKLSEDFKIWNHSIPEHKQRKVKNDEELRAIFRRQMAGCTYVFVYANSNLPQKSYVKMELEVAQELGKTIYAVRPKGTYYIPQFIKKFDPEYIWNDIRTLQKTLGR